MLREHVKTGGRYILAFAVTQNVFTLVVFALVRNAISVRQFLTTSKGQVAMIKSSIVSSILYIMQKKLSRFVTD